LPCRGYTFEDRLVIRTDVFLDGDAEGAFKVLGMPANTAGSSGEIKTAPRRPEVIYDVATTKIDAASLSAFRTIPCKGFRRH
jgi:hypothetical protein